MITVSDVTGKIYDDMDCCFFRNIYQSAFYLAHNATLVDLFTDSKGKLVFVFLKSDHKLLIDAWMKNKENKDIE